MAETYTVVKGDTLWGIAEKYLGDGTKYKQLAAINNISNPDRIYVGQKIRLSGSSSSSTKKVPAVLKVKINQFGLQSDTDNTLFVTWSWDKSNTDHYKVVWQYDSGDKHWFTGNESTTTLKESTYNMPSNAKQVRVRIQPISKKKTVNNKETPYWGALWTTSDTYKTKDIPPNTPPVPTVKLDGLQLTAEVVNLAFEASFIQFQVIRDDGPVFNTGKAAVKTSSASYTCALTAGGKYKVRCRSNRDNLYSEWSDYSSNLETIPATPTAFTKCEPKTETSIFLEWAKVSNATSYDIEYAVKKSYFDGSDQVKSKTGITTTSYEMSSDIESGQEYFFRLRAVNSVGHSGWSEISSTIIGGRPAAPTTWSSTNTVITGEPLNLYWVHNSKDGSSQTYAELELIIDGVTETHTIQNSTKEDEKDKTSTYAVKMVNDDGTPRYTDGAKILWRVRTAGIANVYGDWSIQRAVDIYAPPTLDLKVTNLAGNVFETLESFPFHVSALAGPNTQHPIGYHLTITSNDIYETVDNVGNSITINEGAQIYSKYFDTSDPLAVDISAGDLSLENNISYTVTCSVSMDSGLSAESSTDFTVSWSDMEYAPNAEISIDEESFSAYIKPYCMYNTITYHSVTYSSVGRTYTVGGEIDSSIFGDVVNGVFTTTGEQVYYGVNADGANIYYCIKEEEVLVEDVELSVYRREFDGKFTELARKLDGSKNTTVTDPHPALDYARYRIVAMSKTTGSISYYDPPGHIVGGKAAIIQWDEAWSNFDIPDNEDALEQPAWSGSLLKLPYNIDVQDRYKADVSLIEYAGREHPVGYYGTHLGETSVWSMAVPKDDEETLYALRRLAVWMGNVYVREPSGSGYWANVNVSFSQKHCDPVIPVTIDVARVEGGV